MTAGRRRGSSCSASVRRATRAPTRCSRPAPSTSIVLDDRDNEALREKAQILETLGATITLGPGSTAELPKDVDVVVTSPGVPPHAPLLAAGGRAGGADLE